LEGVIVASIPMCNQAVRTDKDGGFKVSWYRRLSPRVNYLLARDIQRNLVGLVKINEENQFLEVKLEPAYTLQGQVTDLDGNAIVMAAVNLRASLANYVAYLGSEILTDDEGFYQIKAVPPPNLDFSYRSIEIHAEGYGPQGQDKIILGNDPAELVTVDNIVLPPADQSISGVVVDADDMPAVGVSIILRGGLGSKSGQPSRRTVTDAEGRFFIDQICKGPLKLQTMDSSAEEIGTLEAQGGDQNVKIIKGQRRVHSRQPMLAGKPLPDLMNFKFTSSLIQGEDKSLLICFFDLNQRPSRHCVTELVKRAAGLSEKNVAVIGVQTGELDQKVFDEMIKSYQVPFTVVMAGDEVVNEMRLNWGVRALPWLILTDKEHIVNAEGFEVDELEGKIKVVIKNEVKL